MDSRITRLRPNLLTVRGALLRQNPRAQPPPATRNSHRQKNVPQPEKLQTLKTKPQTQSLAEYWASLPGEGTDLERIIRRAAAELNFQFDAEQFVVPLLVNGSYTRIDFVTFSPLRAVYPQGKQHYLRLDAFQQDMLQDLELRSNGWMVFRHSYRRIYADPLQVMREIILGIETFTGQDEG